MIIFCVFMASFSFIADFNFSHLVKKGGEGRERRLKGIEEGLSDGP